MNKLAKGILFAVAAAAAIVVLAALWVNLYVESEGVQMRLQAALREQLRMPINLAQIHFSWSSGLRVIGVTVPETTGPAGAKPPNFLDAPEVTARILLRPLLSHRLVINELVISQPNIVWVQTSGGKWQLPAETELAPPSPSPDALATPPVLSTPSLSSTPGLAAEHQQPSPKEFEFNIVAARIENGTFRFLDQRGEVIAVFEGVTVNCPTVGGETIRGAARIQRVVYRGGVTMENMTTPFSFSGGRLELPQIDARVAQGSVRGSYVLEPLREGSPFTLDLLFDGVNLQDLLNEVDAVSGGLRAEGTLQGSLDIYGMHAMENSFGGRGQVVLRNGRMEQYPLLQMIGQALQIDELTRLDLQAAQLDLRFGENKVFVDSLVLESPNVSLTSKGTTDLNGEHLELAALLSVDPKVGRRLPDWVAANFQPVAGTDRRAIHFGIGGSVQKPKTDLMRVMVGQKIEKPMIQLLRFLNGGGSHKKKNEKPAETPPEADREPAAATPTPPAATPAPAPAPTAAQPH